jgi:hypothetical protein
MFNMTPTENLRAAPTDHTVAVARWDDDGGAPSNSPSAGKIARDERTRPTAKSADSTPGDTDEIPPPS